MSNALICDSCGRQIDEWRNEDYLTINTVDLLSVEREVEDEYEGTITQCVQRKSRSAFHFCDFCKKYALDALKSVHALSRENLESLRANQLREIARSYNITLSKNTERGCKSKSKEELIDELIANDLNERG